MKRHHGYCILCIWCQLLFILWLVLCCSVCHYRDNKISVVLLLMCWFRKLLDYIDIRFTASFKSMELYSWKLHRPTDTYSFELSFLYLFFVHGFFQTCWDLLYGLSWCSNVKYARTSLAQLALIDMHYAYVFNTITNWNGFVLEQTCLSVVAGSMKVVWENSFKDTET